MNLFYQILESKTVKCLIDVCYLKNLWNQKLKKNKKQGKDENLLNKNLDDEEEPFVGFSGSGIVQLKKVLCHLNKVRRSCKRRKRMI
ncbi:hypothetical protein O3M35_006034 [Rhynocoris fuscipes]|uniref:Uncharacterized protein n=1 Tax=Rhynocoris fuscipes TaxID=488301 RepID=A0AAW1DBV2_9HEMI